MKKSEIYVIHDDTINIVSNNTEIKISEIKKVDLKIDVVRKSASGEVLNSIANSVSGSIANGNELVNVNLVITYGDKNICILCLHDKPVIRNNLEYHNLVKRTRKLKDLLLKDIKI